MILFQFGKHPFHKGLAEKTGTVLHLETAAVLVYCCHFLVIQTDNLPVSPQQGSLLLLKVLRVHNRSFPFSIPAQIRIDSFAKLQNPGDISQSRAL